MTLPCPFLHALYIHLAVAIWFMLKAWQTKLVPEYVRYLWVLWSTNTRGLYWIILACTVSLINVFVSYLASKEIGALIDHMHLHGTENLLSRCRYLMILFGLTASFSKAHNAVSVRISDVWQDWLGGDVFGHLVDLSAHNADRFLFNNDADDSHEYHDTETFIEDTNENEFTEDCDSEYSKDCDTHESMDSSDADELIIDCEEHVDKAMEISEFLNEAVRETFPAVAKVVSNTILLSQIVGNEPAIFVTLLGYLDIFLFSYINNHSQLFKTMRKTKSDFLQGAKESIRNWTTVHCFNKSKQEKARFYEAHKIYAAADRHYTDSFMTNECIQEVLLLFLQYVTLFFAVDRTFQASFSVGDIAVLLLLWDAIFLPCGIIEDQVCRLKSIRGTVEEISRLLKRTPTIADTSSSPLVVNEGRVVFKDVSFSYSDSEPVLRDVSLIVEPGTTIALVGEPGSGKSTMLNLLLRCYDVGEGSISIDGHDLRNVSLSSLRDALGVVSQKTQLFSRSIRENLKYGRPDATDEEMYEACKMAAIHEVIEALPCGYSTRLTVEKSKHLDNGVAQRIAIARAIIKMPRLLVFDEPTASMDSATTICLRDGFQKASTGLTTFIATRRISMAKAADLIVVLWKGQIVEQGTHEELINSGGEYFSMRRAQGGDS